MFFYVICTKITFLPLLPPPPPHNPCEAKENGHAKSRAFSMTADML